MDLGKVLETHRPRLADVLSLEDWKFGLPSKARPFSFPPHIFQHSAGPPREDKYGLQKCWVPRGDRRTLRLPWEVPIKVVIPLFPSFPKVDLA